MNLFIFSIVNTVILFIFHFITTTIFFFILLFHCYFISALYIHYIVLSWHHFILFFIKTSELIGSILRSFQCGFGVVDISDAIGS